nr:G protein-coupled receptor [Proales similis]
MISGKQGMCRMTRLGAMPQSLFELASCMKCFTLLHIAFPNLHVDLDEGPFFFLYNQTRKIYPNREADIALIAEMLETDQFTKWRSCCWAARRCCQRMIDQAVYLTDGTSRLINQCGMIWDGWTCHSNTNPGRTSIVKCPNYMVSEDCHIKLGFAHLECLPEARWYNNSYGIWTNYTACFRPFTQMKRSIISLSIIFHSISLLFLLAGLVIFSSYRRLQVSRVRIHKFFFLSLLAYSVLRLAWELTIMKGSVEGQHQKLQENHFSCITLFMALNYVRSTNYFWMFNESFFLFKLLLAVFEQPNDLTAFHVVGWGTPLIFSIIFAVVSYVRSNHSCWTSNDHLIGIISIPNMVVLGANFLIFVVIMGVISKTLRRYSCLDEFSSFLNMLKSTFTLMPLFGIQYLLMPYRLCESHPMAEVQHSFSAVLEGLQGTAVVIIFCLSNQEVKELLWQSVRRKWETHRVASQYASAGRVQRTISADVSTERL